MVRLMRYEGRFVGFFIGAVVGGLVAAETLRWSDLKECAPLIKECKKIEGDIGTNYNRLFDERGFSISYNDLEKLSKEEKWSKILEEKSKKAIYLQGEIVEIKNREDTVYWLGIMAIFGGFVGYQFGKIEER